jgi:hypothetical protein
VISEEKRNQLIEEDASSEKVIVPFLKGRDINRYEPLIPRRYLIFTRQGTEIDDYPAIKGYLAQFKNELMPKPEDWPSDKKWPGRKAGSYEWYEIQDTVAYHEAFETPKMMLPDIASRAEVAFDETGGKYCVNTAYAIGSDSKYLLGVLNSRLITFVYEHLSYKYRGGYLRFTKQYLERLPIRPIDENDAEDVRRRDAIVTRVDRMLDLHARRAEAATDAARLQLQQQIDAVDAEIDRLVYALYGLSEADIAIIEDAT